MQLFLRVLLSFSVLIAGTGRAMPVEIAALNSPDAVSHPHCEEHASAATLHGASEEPAARLRHEHVKKGMKDGCCKAGTCACPHGVAAIWSGGVTLSEIGTDASDFNGLRSDYRSPPPERLIRPPIV